MDVIGKRRGALTFSVNPKFGAKSINNEWTIVLKYEQSSQSRSSEIIHAANIVPEPELSRRMRKEESFARNI